ncbi:MAG: hypothetical protein ABIR70_07345 [Bryobacteraceae bacterium]
MADSPQFQKAEYAEGGPQCVGCKAAISGEYFRLSNGRTVCPACAANVQAVLKSPSHAAFVRGILYGSLTAAACCVGYATVLMLTGFEIGLVSILVGYLVGTAVRKGSQGFGGRRCQIAAVALTYLAITFSYIPVGIQQYNAQLKGESKDKAVKQAGPPLTAGSFGMAVVVLTGLAIASPFLQLTNGIGGLLGIFIIFLGLQRAWAITGRADLAVHGPFQPEETAAVG